MSYKQRALALMVQLGASDEGTYFDEGDRVWRMDYGTPVGKQWRATGSHSTWTLEYTLTDCWKSLLKTAKLGWEDCADTCDCRHWEDEDIAQFVAMEPPTPTVKQCKHSLGSTFDPSAVVWSAPNAGKLSAPCKKCGVVQQWNILG